LVYRQKIYPPKIHLFNISLILFSWWIPPHIYLIIERSAILVPAKQQNTVDNNLPVPFYQNSLIEKEYD